VLIFFKEDKLAKLNIKFKKVIEKVLFNFQMPKENKKALEKKLKNAGKNGKKITISEFLNTAIEQYLGDK